MDNFNPIYGNQHNGAGRIAIYSNNSVPVPISKISDFSSFKSNGVEECVVIDDTLNIGEHVTIVSVGDNERFGVVVAQGTDYRPPVNQHCTNLPTRRTIAQVCTGREHDKPVVVLVVLNIKSVGVTTGLHTVIKFRSGNQVDIFGRWGQGTNSIVVVQRCEGLHTIVNGVQLFNERSNTVGSVQVETGEDFHLIVGNHFLKIGDNKVHKFGFNGLTIVCILAVQELLHTGRSKDFGILQVGDGEFQSELLIDRMNALEDVVSLELYKVGSNCLRLFIGHVGISPIAVIRLNEFQEDFLNGATVGQSVAPEGTGRIFRFVEHGCESMLFENQEISFKDVATHCGRKSSNCFESLFQSVTRCGVNLIGFPAVVAEGLVYKLCSLRCSSNCHVCGLLL